MKSRKLYINDLLLNILIVVLCVAIPFAVSYNKRERTSVRVTKDGETAAVLPIETNAEYSPDGGHTVVTVRDKKAYISYSDCPDGLCMEMLPVTKNGGSVVCLPNKVTVTLVKSDENGGTDVDAG